MRSPWARLNRFLPGCGEAWSITILSPINLRCGDGLPRKREPSITIYRMHQTLVAFRDANSDRRCNCWADCRVRWPLQLRAVHLE